ncbi:MAG: hypothetical protein H6735_06385 [Alphaproteobacteria bacterium]|nr:hypothetical protein [Alphaproteobacteria bacterium]
MSPTLQVLLAGLAYVGVGLGVAVVLRRRGAEAATASSAVVVWPLLLPMLSDATPPRGPLADRIDSTFAALATALAHPAAAEVDWKADAEGLRTSLHTADARLALVDRLLGDAGDDPGLREEAERLRSARDHAAAEIAAVLAGVGQLRLRLGLLALSGETASIGEQLRRWRDQVAALDEVARIP